MNACPTIEGDVQQIIEQYYRMSDLELACSAEADCRRVHGEVILLRGLIEISNRCTRNCLYCGIRRANRRVRRYSLSEAEIRESVRAGFQRGLRTFVLQGGEDPQWSTAAIARVVRWIKDYTGGQAAVTLSLGIKSRRDYALLRQAGADRYLLRFETSDPEMHSYLRDGVSLARRLEALKDLRDLEYETGTGYMVGLPGESERTRVGNALLTRELAADMVGIGPFIPHPHTPLAGSPQQPLSLTLRAVSLVRLLLPRCHMPATTAAGSLDPQGREKAISAGANVLMPNLTPTVYKANYQLYPGKICLDESGVKCIGCLGLRVKSVGRSLDFSRGAALRADALSERLL